MSADDLCEAWCDALQARPRLSDEQLDALADVLLDVPLHPGGERPGDIGMRVVEAS